MISFLQKLRKSAAVSTDRRIVDETQPAEEHSLVSKVIWDWPEGEPVRVDVALERFPQLLDSPRAIVELAIEEFNERRDAGEQLSATDFAERFPEVRSQLLDSLVFEKALKEMTGWFQSVLAPKDDSIQWPEVGDQVAGFQLVEPLGSGGFSRVFVARELGYENRKVAVKVCRQDTHEARTLATLTHSGIGAVHYVRPIPETGLTAICMPLTSRSTLNDVLRCAAGNKSGRPTSAEIVWNEVRSRNSIDSAKPAWADSTFAAWAQNLMSHLAEALAASHAQNIVHCDLKPTNVLVTREGKPTLVDFNVAFRRNAVASPANIGGTLPYMAPEQIRAFAGEGFSSIGPPTDIYGLAATIYELLTGRLPFGAAPPADDGLQGLLERRRIRPASIRATNPQVSLEFETLILECLNYEEAARPQNAETLIARLATIGQSPAETTPATRRATALRITAAAGLLLAVTFLPIKGKQEATSDAPNVTSNAAIKARQLTREEEITQLLTVGYDALEARKFEQAETIFADAMDRDPSHEGAVIAWIRANFYLGNVEAVERAGVRIFNDGSPEKAALRGLCHAGVENHVSAIPNFQTALDGGMATKEVLTDLGYSLYRNGQYDEAIEILEQARRMGGDTSTANLILVRAYPMVWQRRVRGKYIHKYDEQLLITLIEECEDSPAKYLVASQIYVSFVHRFGKDDPNIADNWGKRALDAMKRGCELGLDPAYWNGIRRSLPESILNSPAAAQFASVPAERVAPQHRSFFLLDPLIGSRLERCTDRKLTSKAASGSESLVATTAK